MTQNFKVVIDELKNITTVNLIANASSILEKILWAMIAIFGTLFIYQNIDAQLRYWNENPALVTKQTVKLSDMPVPSVTFCHKGLQKYGPVERLANMINPEKTIPKEVFQIRNEFLKMQFLKIKDYLEREDFCSWLFGDKRNYDGILREISFDKQDLLKSQVCHNLSH